MKTKTKMMLIKSLPVPFTVSVTTMISTGTRTGKVPGTVLHILHILNIQYNTVLYKYSLQYGTVLRFFHIPVQAVF